MRIIVTLQELLDRGKWGHLCNIRQLDPWAAENMPLHTDFNLTVAEARDLGLLNEDQPTDKG